MLCGERIKSLFEAIVEITSKNSDNRFCVALSVLGSASKGTQMTQIEQIFTDEK